MILQSDLVAALKAIGIDAEVQVRLAGIPLAITTVRLDELRGLIFLDLGKQESEAGLRLFLSRLSDGDGHAVRCNSLGRLELLRGGE